MRERLRPTFNSLAIIAVAVCATLLSAGDEHPEAAPDVDAVAALLEFVIDADERSARDCLAILTRSVQSGELGDSRVASLREQLGERLAGIVSDPEHALHLDAVLLAAAWGDGDAATVATKLFRSHDAAPEKRVAALQSLIATEHESVLADAAGVLADASHGSADFRGQVLSALGALETADVAATVLDQYARLEPELQPRAVELLSQRPIWAGPLLNAIVEQRLPKDALNLNQLRRITRFDDEALQEQFQSVYGTLREGRDPQREQYVQKMRKLLEETPGDPHNGVLVFKKLCAQCHKIHGEGAEVGPDITRNGRNNWDQLLSNVFDPSLVIGPGYQARQLVTFDGRVLTGLPVEESDQRVVLKMQGDKTETIPRDEIDIYETSDVSLMPEELEKQLSPQEIADLMSFLALDRPPSDPAAKRLSGAPPTQ